MKPTIEVYRDARDFMRNLYESAPPRLRAWLANSCDFSPRLYVPVRRLWDEWNRAGGALYSRREFAQALADRGFPVVEMGGRKYFHGLALKCRGLPSFQPEHVAAVLLWIEDFTDPDPSASIPLVDLWGAWRHKDVISNPHYLALQLEALGFSAGRRIIRGFRIRG